MVKKGFALLIMVVFILPILLQLASAQVGVDLSNPAEIPGQIQNTQQQLEQLKNQSTWTYLGQRFQTSLLQNPVIAGIDGFFTKISIVFSVLFGMPYSLSITLLFVMALWFLVFVDGGNIIKNYSMFSALTSYGISFAFAVIFAQLKIFEVIVNFTGTLVFAQEAWWARVLLILVVILVLFFADQVSRYVGKYLKKKKEAKEKAETLAAGKEIQATAKGMEKGREIGK